MDIPQQPGPFGATIYAQFPGAVWHVDHIDQTVTFQGEGITFLFMQPGQPEAYILECPILVTFFLPGPDNPFAHLIPPVDEHEETPSPDNPFSPLSSPVSSPSSFLLPFADEE
ncbi:hypothetical protein Fmac_000782 [Flemingia macrophylla]|uniref:Uncharacterized protein n=1 Tax=Flemingia macrophylla TaxID=520843 RepID=A0ABD1NF74_9FABA